MAQRSLAWTTLLINLTSQHFIEATPQISSLYLLPFETILFLVTDLDMNLTKNKFELNTSASGEKVIFSFLWNEALEGPQKGAATPFV